MVIVTSSSTIASGVTTSAVHSLTSVNTSVTMSAAWTPNCIGPQSGNGSPMDLSSSAYQMLLKQVESLRKENSSLKAELKNNTSHISKLENEASRMKDMVLLLGNPIIGNGSEHDAHQLNNSNYMHYAEASFPQDETSFAGDIASSNTVGQIHPNALQTPLKLQNGMDQEYKKQRPEFLLGLRQNPYGQHSVLHHSALPGSVSPSPTAAVADAMKKNLLPLIAERASIYRTITIEEQTKDFYLKQLDELKSRLDGVSDSDKFSKTKDKTRQQIETEIANLQEKMEQNLGSSEVMKQRLEARIKQLHDIDKEIVNVENHIRKLEMTPTSPNTPTISAQSHPPNETDFGTCTKHASFMRGGTGFTITSTQTPNSISEGIIYEEEFSSCDNSAYDLQVSTSNGKTSRIVQTMTSCIAGRITQNSLPALSEFTHAGIHPHDSLLLSRIDPAGPGSLESLPSQSDIDDTASMHSFTTSLPRHFQSSSVGPKKDNVHSPTFLQANKEELAVKISKMSKTAEGCLSLRRSGGVSLIVQIIHDESILSLPPSWSVPSSPGCIPAMVANILKSAKERRFSMLQALKNIVHCTTDMRTKIEVVVFNHLEFIQGYCELLFEFWVHAQTLQKKPDHTKNISSPNSVNGHTENGKDVAISDISNNINKTYDFKAGLVMVYDFPVSRISTIMKLSHNEATRSIPVINELGGLFVVAELFILHCRCTAFIDLVQSTVGIEPPSPDVVQLQLLRRFVGFALINLTFGDVTNKATLIQMPGLIDTVMAQMSIESEEMQQVMAKLVRNLSWQPDEKCQDILRQKNLVSVLMKCALKSKREDTLKSVLSALWNLSGHCPENRTSICSVKGALAFLVSTLTYRTTDIIESGGGILRNVSSVVATNEEYRQILRDKNCLQILLTHLKAASLTIVSNACGTLWNLSARNAQDQKLLWDLGAVPMLRNLVHSKHSVIARGSSAALRNLISNRPGSAAGPESEKSETVKLKARKQKTGESYDGKKNLPEIEKFSPRHHAWSGAKDKMMSPGSVISPQRHSMQETSSSSPVPDLERGRRFQKGGLHYSGSLGNLPTDFNSENFSKSQSNGSKYISSARNSNSYPDHYSSNSTNNNIAFRNATMPNTNQIRSGKNIPAFTSVAAAGGMLKNVMMFNDQMLQSAQTPGQQATNSPQSNISLRQYFQLIAGKKPLPPSVGTGLGASEQSPSYMQNAGGFGGNPSNTNIPTHLYKVQNIPNVQNQFYPGSGHLVTPGATQTRIPQLQQAGGQLTVPHPQRMQKLMQNTMTPNKPNVLPKCTEDLVRRLQDVEEDYDNDDGPVNYSLQYGDEHMTPGIQSPRTEEIYETAAIVNQNSRTRPTIHDSHSNFMHTGIPSASMNGPVTKSDGGLSGLSSCIGSTGSSAQQRQDASNKRLATVVSSEHPVIDRSNPSLPAAYNSLRFDNDLDFDDEKPTNFGAMYSEEQLYEPIQHQSMGMMPFSEVDQPPYPTADQMQTNLNMQQTTATNNCQSTSEAALEGKEQDDKFDTGAITPGHYFGNYKSGRNSGIMTPRTPMYEDTPMMFSRGSSSLGSVSDGESIHSSITSEPGSRMLSGRVSPSHLPDSPSQSMPVSPRRSPRPRTPVEPPDDDFDKSSEKTLDLPKTGMLVNNSVNKPPMSERIEDRLCKINQPGYITSVPNKDEMNVYRSEGAMSVMTKFSDLTIDSGDKIYPLENDQGVLSKVQSPTGSRASSVNHASDVQSNSDNKMENSDCADRNHSARTDEDFFHPGQRAVRHAGYITSLPTNDEIKNFVHEGTLSPMTAFSEISGLQEDNRGFQKSTGSVFSVPNSSNSNKVGPRSVASNKNSFASRSSATGASVPPPPQTSGKDVVKEGDQEEGDSKTSRHPSNFSSVTSPTSHSINGADEDLGDDSDSLPSSSSDDDDLLQQCIQHGLPKKRSSQKSIGRSSSSKSSNRSSRSSRSKDKSNNSLPTHSGNSQVSHEEKEKKQQEDRRVTNPSPEVVAERKRIDIKQKIESANQKLNGVHILEYMDNLMMKVDDTDKPGTSHSTSKMKQVIDSAEKLQQSYSVRKKIKEDEKHANLTEKSNCDSPNHFTTMKMPKTTGLLPSEPPLQLQSKMRIQSYIREGITSYATEGTPIEMSRSTSLSNLTIDSELGDNIDMTGIKMIRTSHSVSDIKDSSNEILFGNSEGVSSQKPVSSVPMHVRSTSLGSSNCSSPVTKDSREILEVLGQQIADLSLSTAESVVKDPGYTTSLPHTDEIFKYEAEGSQGGGTIFSALTIDSDTKIAPTIPKDDNTAQPNYPQETNVSEKASPGELQEAKVPSAIQRNNWINDNSLEVDDNLSALNSRVKENDWQQPLIAPQFNSHYNNENDNLAMKEEQRKYTIEDTPLYLSGPGSLSSLDFGSDDDNELLNACITSALPVDKRNANPPLPSQILMMQQQSNNTDPHARINHGVPDGKVDSPTSQQIPFVIPTLQQQNYSDRLQMNLDPNISSAYIQSPNDEQWSLIQRDADALAVRLMQQSNQQTSTDRMKYSQDMPLSSSVSLSQPTEGFYRLSRQASMQDSDLSVSSSVLGERHSYDVSANRVKSPHDNTIQNRSSGPKHQGDKLPNRLKTQNERSSKTDKKYSPRKSKDSSAVRRTRNHPSHAKDSSSGSSSSFRQPKHRNPSSNTRGGEMCGCHGSKPRYYNHGPVSASTSHLVDGVKSPSSRPRRKSTNSASKNSVGGYEHVSHHHHHQQKPSRPRNQTKNFYHPSVTQLYPPLKDMVGVLEGVASVAARGDKVVADRNPSQYSGNHSSQPLSKKSSSSSLVRSATFITEKPSQVLLENMTQEEKDHYTNSSMSSSVSPSQSQHSSRSAGNPRTRSPNSSSQSLKTQSRNAVSRGSTHSLKTHSTITKETTKQKGKKKNPPAGQAKPKHNKVWSGIKKLLSPSDDASKTPVNTIPSKNSTPSKSKQKKDAIKGVKTPTRHVKKSASEKLPISSEKKVKQSSNMRTNESGSSLSLSSSSASNASTSDIEVTSSASTKMQGNVTPYGLLPKSPSVNAIMRRTLSTNIPQSRSTGILDQSKAQKPSGSSVWRRTPPKVATSSKTQQSSELHTRSGTRNDTSKKLISSDQQFISINRKATIESENIWVSKKDLANLQHEYSPHSVTTKSKLPIPQGYRRKS
ncbi:uncharacterized protein LOC120336871 isoform X2 [Styela clava]